MSTERPTDIELRRIVMGCERCADPDMHDFYSRRDAFEWRRPRLVSYIAATGASRLGLNRYPHHIIGVYVVVRGRCWALTWKGSRRV